MFVRISRRISTFCQRDITLQMLKTKCIRILSYGFEACPVTKSKLSSINLATNGSYERYKLVIWILLITVDWFVSIYLVLRWSVALKNSLAGSASVKTLQLNMQWVYLTYYAALHIVLLGCRLTYIFVPRCFVVLPTLWWIRVYMYYY